MNLASRNYQEKRNFVRMKVETPISAKIAADITFEGTCHNLSGGGMFVSMPQALPEDHEIEVTLSSNHGHHPILKAITKVKRVHTPEAPFLVGLEIVRLLDAH
jgi:c-di-GMP-binding flagellar brake protein YcgR